MMVFSTSFPLRLVGAPPAARAYQVARLLEYHQLSQTVVILCPNQDSLQEFADDLDTFLSIASPDQDIQISVFPTWEQSPYSSITPTLRTRFARLEVLTHLVQTHDSGKHQNNQKTRQVILTTLEASYQTTLSPALFKQYSTDLELNQTIERDTLTKLLLESGYLRVEIVEDPGTFAIRGEIIDIFPCHHDFPLRIELFGDTIEQIREFNPTNQRTTSSDSLISCFIPPAREVLLNPHTQQTLRERVKAHADQAGISRSIRDPVLEAIRYGSYPDHFDAWAPFAYTEVKTFWDYVPGAFVIYNDELACLQAWEKLKTQRTKHSEETIQKGLILPPPNELYKATSLTPQLYFDALEFARVTSTESIPITRVNILDHVGLVKGSKRHLGQLETEILKWLQEKKKIILFASTPSQLDRIQFLLKEHFLVPSSEGLQIKLGTLSSGFHWPDEKLVVLNESEILGIKKVSKRRTRGKETASDWSGLQILSDLNVGDAVVHIDHGIGRYIGIVRLNLSGAPSDFLQLEYANNDKLYLPVYRLNLIQKYAGSSQTASLSRLGSQQFQKTKEKVKESVKTLAIDLVQLYAERAIRSGVIFSPQDTIYNEFEASFPFEETPDQLQAIEAVQADLGSGKVMDRLVCGDVGYGKTEVAIRAAFRAVNDGKQVAILVPTTLLAQQHEQSFKNRFKEYPILIESFSRFKSPKEQKQILEALQHGKLDIIIGTHRLLSKDVRFQDLGLIIVDEEHRFGVEHKERLKTLKTNTHVLTLTATPIPRTLYMALSGLREISIINTPPVDRLPIRTYLSRYDETVIQKAIEFELSRGGQVFFLHNRVQAIHKVARKLKELVPHAEIIVAHGQQPEDELEEAMMAFYQKKANVLVCTAIIESGLDVPSANTLLIERADTLGLSQLYQIRGRVGRGDQRGYCYLLLPEHGNMTSEAKQRLEVIQKFVELGSGFSIASHDLEIRGGGNLLGPQQSGNIAAVGFDLYTELLEEAIREIQGKPPELDDRTKEPEIKTPFPAYLSEEFIPDVHHRLSLYRRFSVAKTESEVDQLEAELHDRFGHLPLEAQNLIWMIRLKLLLKQRGIHALTAGAEKISLQRGETKQVISLAAQSLQELYFSLEKYC